MKTRKNLPLKLKNLRKNQKLKTLLKDNKRRANCSPFVVGKHLYYLAKISNKLYNLLYFWESVNLNYEKQKGDGCVTVGIYMTTTYTNGTSWKILLRTYELCPETLEENEGDYAGSSAASNI